MESLQKTIMEDYKAKINQEMDVIYFFEINLFFNTIYYLQIYLKKITLKIF